MYQVGAASSIQAKNLSASKPGVQQTCEPADSGARIPAISPWIWKSGMMFSPRSAAVNRSDDRMWRAEAATFCCERGTIFGRDVVPEVCSTRAVSSAAAPPGCAAMPDSVAPRGSSVKLPATSPGTRSATGTPSFSATAIAGVSAPRSTISSRALRSLR